jgi:hypothetical protein
MSEVAAKAVVEEEEVVIDDAVASRDRDISNRHNSPGSGMTTMTETPRLAVSARVFEEDQVG